MALKLRRLEADDKTVGGVLFEFPSGTLKQVAWRHAGRITDTLEMAKKMVVQLVAQLEPRDIDSLNIPSCVAATQRHIQDWNAKLDAFKRPQSDLNSAPGG